LRRNKIINQKPQQNKKKNKQNKPPPNWAIRET
jgi:hypothetical protein